MEVLAVAAVSTEYRLLRERQGNASLDDVDQDLMFPVCGSAEPYYSPDRRAIVTPIQTSLCPQQQAANFARRTCDADSSFISERRALIL